MIRIFLSIIFVALSSVAHSDNNAVLLPLSIDIQANRDAVTLDRNENNIFTVSIDYKTASTSAVQDMFFYIDGRYQKEFKKKALPFSFKINLRGYVAGNHEIRIDVVDLSNAEKILARQSVVVSVQGPS